MKRSVSRISDRSFAAGGKGFSVPGTDREGPGRTANQEICGGRTRERSRSRTDRRAMLTRVFISKTERPLKTKLKDSREPENEGARKSKNGDGDFFEEDEKTGSKGLTLTGRRTTAYFQNRKSG